MTTRFAIRVLNVLLTAARLLLCIGMIAESLSLIMLAPIVIASQPSDQKQIQSDGDALSEADELDEEVLTLYNDGRYREALPLAKRALAIRERILVSNHADIADSLNNLGMILVMIGDIKAARPYLERALAITEKIFGPIHRDTASSLNSLGVLLHAMGDFKGARAHLERALAIREHVLGPDHRLTAQSFNNLGALFYTMGDLQSARHYYEHSLTIRQKIFGSEHPDTAESLNNLGNLLHVMGDFNGARAHLERALAIRDHVLGATHPDTALSLNNLGVLLRTTGDLKGALRCYEYALAVRQKVLGLQHPDTAMSLNSLSVLFEAMGDIQQAIATRELALNAEEYALAETLSIGTEQEKKSYLQTLLRSTHAAVSLHVHTAPNDARATAMALTTVLRRKGRVLDATVESLRLIRERLSHENQSLFDKLIELRDQRAYLLLRPPEVMAPDERHARLKVLNKQIHDTEAKLSAASAVIKEIFTPVTLASVQAQIPIHAVLVEFFVYRTFNSKTPDPKDGWGDPHYVAYVLSRTGIPRWVSLGTAQKINAAAEDFRRSVASCGSDVLKHARELDALTMEKVRPLLGDVRTMVISPDGVLNLVPFAALVDEEGRYLVERYRLSYVTSGRDLLRSATVVTWKEQPLVLGNAAFGGRLGPADDRGETKRAADMAALQFGPLPGTAEEVRAIGRILHLPEKRILTEGAATEATVKKVKGPQILHLATHGFFLPDISSAPSQELPVNGRLEDPLLRSGLALSSFNRRHEATSANDGVLTALEVVGLDLWGTEVVVLSACETGLGDVQAGEGVFGLRRAFVLAGARTQVMTLWHVADEPTKDLMVSWYAQLQKGVSRSEALHRAQLNALEGWALPATNARLRGVKRVGELEQPMDPRIVGTRHPYYWASFILSGAIGPISVRQ